MRRYILIVAVTALTLGFSACNSSAQKDAKTIETAKPKGKYYCTMHPEITSDKPGTCSKCGMDLAERDTTK
ncbi:heavy metal-binding domain-containing protein [Mucilaginibacter sp. MD40]|uniref:heavy metal-binding domain-containing protein n=1 Tax=Mucilaginibacter sp. MD40 TaxID=2029590 RepID=UPI00117FB68A|nr:heavy metal-binding domain-containing protein [Mucilaginibacter sp. MD40]